MEEHKLFQQTKCANNIISGKIFLQEKPSPSSSSGSIGGAGGGGGGGMGGLGGLFAGGMPKLKAAGERGKPGTGGMTKIEYHKIPC